MNKGCGHRLYTFLIYLNDDFEGGGTDFPRMNLCIKPKKGKAILFQNIDERFDLIPESLHAGCPVTSGTKWVANKWIRVWPTEMMQIQKNEDEKAIVKKTYNFGRFAAAGHLAKESLRVMNYILHCDIEKLRIWYVLQKQMIYLNIMYHNSLRSSSFSAHRFQVYELEAFLKHDACIECFHDAHLRRIDDFVTDHLKHIVQVPYEEHENDYYTPLKIMTRRCNNGITWKSPLHDFEYRPLCDQETFGLNMFSLYIFLNDDYDGGVIEFPYISKRIIPKKGNAIAFFGLNEAVHYDIRSFFCLHSIKKGVQHIAEKHVRILPCEMKSILQESKKWKNKTIKTMCKEVERVDHAKSC
jgi:hypothetical protein